MQYSDHSCRRAVKRTINDNLGRMQRCSSSLSRKCTALVAVQLLVFLVPWLSQIVGAQLIGTNLCGCQPATYTFTFDFDLTCDDNNVEGGPGINETACLTEIRGEDDVPDEDLIPVTVQSVQIFELDRNLQVFSQTVRTGTFVDGSNFTYTSIISTISDLENISSLPRGLQLVITGLNSKEQSTVNTYIITYTNDCGIFPILTEGQTSGWTIFSDLGDPPSTICPLVPSMAPASSVPGTASPTVAPLTLPSLSPSVTPITVEPPARTPSIITFVPVIPETEAPVAPVPTPVETDAPTKIVLPTCAPYGQGGKGGGKGKGGKGYDTGKGRNGGKGLGKGNDSGKGGKGGKGSGKGDESVDGGNTGKGSGKGDDDSSSKGKGGKGDDTTIQKKKVYDGKMDKLSTEDEERRLGTGGFECPEIPDDDYYIGKGEGGGKGKDGGKGMSGEGGKGGKGMMNEGSGKGGKGSKGESNGKGGKGASSGKGENTEDGGKGKGSIVLMKKVKDKSGDNMEITRTSRGKGKHMSKDEGVDDDYRDNGKEETR